MQYYKNSMRYVKFLLFSVVFYAIFMGLMGDKINAILSGKQNGLVLQEYLLEKASSETQDATAETVGSESQEEYTERVFNEFKQIYPNMTPEEEVEIREVIEKKYKAKANNAPTEIKYEEPTQEQKEAYQNDNNDNQNYYQMGTENMQNMEVVPDKEL